MAQTALKRIKHPIVCPVLSRPKSGGGIPTARGTGRDDGLGCEVFGRLKGKNTAGLTFDGLPFGYQRGRSLLAGPDWAARLAFGIEDSRLPPTRPCSFPNGRVQADANTVPELIPGPIVGSPAP